MLKLLSEYVLTDAVVAVIDADKPPKLSFAIPIIPTTADGLLLPPTVNGKPPIKLSVKFALISIAERFR